MNIAIIIAGGSGSRMGQDIPKQFINVYDKPVLIYTLESFQRHPQIDAIEVVCIDGWHDILWAYAKQFNIYKLKWVISGGKTGQEIGGEGQPGTDIAEQAAQALKQDAAHAGGGGGDAQIVTGPVAGDQQ